MSTLLESIDRLITESPENLGFPKDVVRKIEMVIPDHRKNQHYFAEFFKSWEGRWRRRSLVDTLNKALEVDEKARLLKKFGVRAVEVKPEEAYSVRDRDELSKRLFALITSIGTIDDLLTLRKKAGKAVNGSAKDIERKIDARMIELVDIFKGDTAPLGTILKWDPNAYREFKGLDLTRAKDKADELSMKMEVDSSRVFMELGGGYFWYEVDDNECDLEGERMNHCGMKTDHSYIMYSLRDEHNKPHVSLEYDPRENSTVQIRGANNDMPKKKYWDHVAKIVGKLDAFVADDERDITTKEEHFYKAITKYGGAYSLISEQYANAYNFTLSNLPNEIDSELNSAFQGGVSVRGEGGLRSYGRGEYDVFMELDLSINGVVLSNHDKFLDIIEDYNALDELSDQIYDFALDSLEGAFEPGIVYEVGVHPPGISRGGDIMIEGIDFEPDFETVTRDKLDAYKRGIMDSLSASGIGSLIREIEDAVDEIEVETEDY